MRSLWRWPFMSLASRNRCYYRDNASPFRTKSPGTGPWRRIRVQLGHIRLT
jgi:hypothetical protein